MTETILVIAAHPDDEVLGCGGTIARQAQSGGRVHIAVMAEGVTSRTRKRQRNKHQRELSELAVAAKKAALKVGATSIELYDLPDNRTDSVDLIDIAKRIEPLITKYKPSTVYTHHWGDMNIDHQRIHDAVMIACRPHPDQCVRKLLCFEVASSTEWQTASSPSIFAPNYFVDITATLATKIAALRCYESELRAWPHPRSIKGITHLARWRGASCGVEAAEAFVVSRIRT